MKRLGLFVIAASLTAGAFAQDLDTTFVRDQLNLGGSRGNAQGSLTSGGSAYNGTEYLDYSGTDATVTPTTSVRYINTWAKNTEVESPIFDVTVGTNVNPDYAANFFPAIFPNTRPGATDGTKAIFIGDDGGHNGLYWGDSNDSDYFVEVDMFCPVSTVAAGFEVAGVGVRSGRDDNPVRPGSTTGATNYETSYNMDRDGAYCVIYDYQNKVVKAVKWTRGNTTANIQNRVASTYTQYGVDQPLTVNGWHTFKIVALGNTITFFLDGTLIGTAVDIDPDPTTHALTDPYTHGRAGIYYREANLAPAAERQGVFDQLRSGPALSADVSDWNLY